MWCVNCNQTLKTPMQRLYCSEKCKNEYFRVPKGRVVEGNQDWRWIDLSYEPPINTEKYKQLRGLLRVAYYHYLRNDLDLYEVACNELSVEELDWLYENV